MKLVLLDLDNTLIDAEYRLTVPEDEFRAVVQELADKNIRVGLCSDSAAITLCQWAERLGLTGPIVAERGAIVWDSSERSANIINTEQTAWLRELREAFVLKVMKDMPGATLMLGDATQFIKARPMNPAMTEQVFAINGFRVASFSFFACRPNNDRSALEPDPALLEQASAMVEELLSTFNKSKQDLFWDENPRYGILIVHAATTEKKHGISTMIDHLGPSEIVMVGDGMADFLDLPHVAQYAVGNADPLYKAKASFVAEHPLTEGVIECLRRCE